MAQTLELIQDILKTEYLPAFRNQIGIKPSPFLEKITKTTAKNNVITAAATYGLNGGVGYGVDGSDTPISGPQLYKNFEIETKNLYCNIEISDKTIKLGTLNQSSMIDALHQEVQSSFDAANWNLGRALFGDGSGILCYPKEETNGPSRLNYIIVDDTRNLKEGIIVDICSGSSVHQSALRIMAIDRGTGKVTFDRTVETDFMPTVHFLTLQNSFNREITGLGAVMRAAEKSADNDEYSIYGKNVKSNPWLIPTTIDAKNNLTDITITNAMRDAERNKNGDIDLIMMGDEAFNAYQTHMKEDNSYVTNVQNLKFKGGHTGFEVLFGNKTAIVVNEGFVPSDEVWGVATKDWIYESTKFDFASENSSIFTLVPNKNYYRALLTSYGNLICKNPGGSIRITNCKMKTT